MVTGREFGRVVKNEEGNCLEYVEGGEMVKVMKGGQGSQKRVGISGSDQDEKEVSSLLTKAAEEGISKEGQHGQSFQMYLARAEKLSSNKYQTFPCPYSHTGGSNFGP